MKNTLFSAFILLAIIGFAKPKPDKFSLNIVYSFKNIEDGYDHTNKIIVYIDGDKAGESRPKKESEKNSLKLEIPKGKHEIKVENWSKYEDQWELHDIANNYSVDLINTETISMNKNRTMTIIYDLDNGVEVQVK